MRESKTDNRAAIAGLLRTMERVVGEWRHVRGELGLKPSSTWAAVAAKLRLDRGTAQRLVKIGRLTEITPVALDLFPGPAALEKVCLAVERVLSDEHPNAQRLAAACDRLSEQLNRFGGSKAAAVRAVDEASHGEDASPHGDDSRQHLVDAMADFVGFAIGLRYDLLIMRPTPRKPNRIDLAMAQCYLDCRGRSGALPLAYSRHGCASNGAPVASGGMIDGRSVALLSSGTSSPPPGLLFTGDAVSQSAIVEPNWTEFNQSLDLSFLQIERDAQDSPWVERPHVYCTEMLIRYPTRRVIMQRLIHRDIHEGVTASFGVFSTRRVPNLARPWFDRLPEPASMVSHQPPFDPAAANVFPRHRQLASEVFDRIGWAPKDFHSYVIDSVNPVPLSWYSFEIEKHDH
ncbi:MAG: hypothetical protein SFY96_04765 [Planctomycetota bacterium]|nr:hypothetical protein [Planctomycetota bacterium]